MEYAQITTSVVPNMAFVGLVWSIVWEKMWKLIMLMLAVEGRGVFRCSNHNSKVNMEGLLWAISMGEDSPNLFLKEVVVVAAATQFLL
jgi:hypothetical protein